MRTACSAQEAGLSVIRDRVCEIANLIAQRTYLSPHGSVPGRHEEEGRHWSAFIAFLKEHRHRMPALEEFRIFDLKWPMHE